MISNAFYILKSFPSLAKQQLKLLWLLSENAGLKLTLAVVYTLRG